MLSCRKSRTKLFITAMNHSKKERAFEYVVPLIADWWKKQNPNFDFKYNDLSILKIMKILFFIVSVKANKDRNNYGVLDVFDKWLATPYGHIEKDVLQMIKGKKGVFNNFVINNKQLIIKHL